MRKKQKQYLDRRTWGEATVFVLAVGLIGLIAETIYLGDILQALRRLNYLLVVGIIMLARYLLIRKK